MVEHVVSVGLCGLEYLMAMLCDSFVVVLNLFHFNLHSFFSYTMRKSGWKFLFYFFYTINYCTHRHTYKYKHSFIKSALSWVISVARSYSFQSPLISSLFTVLIASTFLVRASWEGCLGWDTGLALDTWFICLLYWLEPLFGSGGFTVSGREWMYLLHLPWSNIYRLADVFGK